MYYLIQIFTPDDDQGVWKLAMMWFNVADSNVHESVYHLGKKCLHITE